MVFVAKAHINQCWVQCCPATGDHFPRLTPKPFDCCCCSWCTTKILVKGKERLERMSFEPQFGIIFPRTWWHLKINFKKISFLLWGLLSIILRLRTEKVCQNRERFSFMGEWWRSADWLHLRKDPSTNFYHLGKSCLKRAIQIASSRVKERGSPIIIVHAFTQNVVHPFLKRILH